jgi:hypothetical protein
MKIAEKNKIDKNLAKSNALKINLRKRKMQKIQRKLNKDVVMLDNKQNNCE